MTPNCKQIAILGSTGSIGRQTLDLIERHPDRYRASVLVAGRQVDLLIDQARRFRPQWAIIADDSAYPKLHDALAPLGIATASGDKAVEAAAAAECVDMVVTATVGYSGLLPTIAAIRAGKDIALANKETMVVAGEYITSLLKDSTTRVFPVDSEHSAIFQCLRGEDPATVKRLIITASGGPFRTWSADQIARATAAQALKHPNWNMGAKITIDSASMLNKAFEIIEARWLFGIDPQCISAIVHPQSIIHSMVEFIDGGIKAQMGVPDMTLPIAYALGEASRIDHVSDFCDLLVHNQLSFEQPDLNRFPCLGYAIESLQAGGAMPIVLNGANEESVAAFLEEKIPFGRIGQILRDALDAVPQRAVRSIADVYQVDAEARERAKDFIRRLE